MCMKSKPKNSSRSVRTSSSILTKKIVVLILLRCGFCAASPSPHSEGYPQTCKFQHLALHFVMSPIQDFYTNQTVFLTGATGFLGKLLAEKLLRTCPSVKKIVILVRPKRNKTPEQRLASFFDTPCFDALKSADLDFYKKIQLVNGDLAQPFLGLNEDVREVLKKEVTCVIHAAANVRFDTDLKSAVDTNVRSVRDLLEMVKHMEKLRAFVYVSTAFSHCCRGRIQEEFYDVNIKPEKLLQLVDVLDEQTLKALTPYILERSPNTYTYTKSLAEELIRSQKQVLPIAVVRPAIITSTYKEPVGGWVDNFQGLVGVVLGCSLGVLRSLHLDRNLKARLVPADFVVNNILAAAWDVETSKNEFKNDLIPIYNYAGCDENSITWDRFIRMFKRFEFVYPLSSSVGYPFFLTSSHKFVHKLRAFFLHTLFSYLVDALLLVAGKAPMAVDKYQRINRLLDSLSYFTTNSWDFDSGNVDRLWEKLDADDKELFNFNIKKMSWDKYSETCVIGGRLYLMKDPLSTVPRARRKMYFLAAVHYVFILFVVYLLWWIFTPLLKCIF